MQAGAAKRAAVRRAGVRAAIDEREKCHRPRPKASILPPACQSARKITEVGCQGPWQRSVSSIPQKYTLHSISVLASSNMTAGSLSRGESMAAAGVGIDGFRLLGRENHRESKNQISAEAVLHHLPQS